MIIIDNKQFKLTEEALENIRKAAVDPIKLAQELDNFNVNNYFIFKCLSWNLYFRITQVCITKKEYQSLKDHFFRVSSL